MLNPDKPFGVVIWDDAHGDATFEGSESELTHSPTTYQSYGWIVRSNSVGVTLAADWAPEGNKWRATQFVPRAMVREEIHLRLVKKANRAARQSADTP